MLKIVVIDDEPPARRAMLRLIAEHGGLEVVGEAGSVRDAIGLIEATRPDVALLDIEMAGQSGFALLHALAAPPQIIVVTAHSMHAVQAFDIEAVDFLLKPVLPSRFAAAIRRLRMPDGFEPVEQKRLRLPTQRGLRFVETGQIISLQAERDYTRITLVGEPPLLASRALGTIAAEVPNPPFARLSRSVMLNLDHVAGVRTITRERTDVVLARTGTVISLGRSAAAMLRLRLAE